MPYHTFMNWSINKFRTAAQAVLVLAVVVLMLAYNRQHRALPPPAVEPGQTASQQPEQKLPVQPLPKQDLGQNTANPAPLPSAYLDGTIELAGQVLNIQLADDLPEQLAGLSGRQSMAENEGMLFVLPPSIAPEFWMKDMLFPLDIVWLRQNRVVGIAANAEVEKGKIDNDLKRYVPAEKVDMVLEINAGWAGKHGLVIGDEVKINFNGSTGG